MPFNEVFTALAHEAQFTKEILGSGVTQIRHANYAKKGAYFQAFTSLSTGLERIGKICLMLDYYIDNQGRFPDFNSLKKVSHNLNLLYTKALDIKSKRNINHRFLDELSDPIHQNILKALSDFAVGDRYSNINLLVNARQQSDPLKYWYENVDNLLFTNRVSLRKKEKILNNAIATKRMMGSVSSVLHFGEDGEVITDVGEASLRSGTNEAISGYRQMYIIHIIRFWVELLTKLQYEAMSLGKEDIPFFSEIFAHFYNDDSYIRTRKTWDKV